MPSQENSKNIADMLELVDILVLEASANKVAWEFKSPYPYQTIAD